MTIHPAEERAPAVRREARTVVLANAVTILAVVATWISVLGPSVVSGTWWAVTATMTAIVLGLIALSWADWTRMRSAHRLAGTYVLPVIGGLLIWLVGWLPFAFAVGFAANRGANLKAAIIAWLLIAVLVIGQGVLSRRSRIAACLAPAMALAGLALAIYLAGL